MLVFSWDAIPQERANTSKPVSTVKELYEAGRWQDVVRTTQEALRGEAESADPLFYRGLALARLERWQEAQDAFEAGLRRNPRDVRFLDELAGLAYRRRDFSAAKKRLRQALGLNPAEDYAANLLASIYFLEGNLDGAVKYWNRIGKPQLADLSYAPQPQLKPILLDRAFQFSQGAAWKREAYLATQAKLNALGVFTWMRFDLRARNDGTFDLVFGSLEEPSWTESKWQNALKLLRGVPYQTVYPEFRNMDGAGSNWYSAYRWDDQKRRLASEYAAPVRNNPAWRFRLDLDGCNENWNLSTTLSPRAPHSAGVNLEKASVGLELQSIPNGNWSWGAGLLFAYRRFRNPVGLPSQASPFFTDGSNLGYRMRASRTLIRFPERRFTVESRASGELGTFFNSPLGRYATFQGDLESTWFPKARGDDYEMRSRFRAGRTLGDVPLDELFVMGFDRDTDLWLRGHPGLNDGQKGSAPLGRSYVLGNWEINKVIYSAPFVSLRMGPFVDMGKVYETPRYFGSPNWLYDTGVQTKVRIFGSFEFVLGYGKDLRTGRNSFFTTVSR